MELPWERKSRITVAWLVPSFSSQLPYSSRIHNTISTSPVLDTTSTNPGLYLHGKDHAIILHLSRMRGFPGRSDSSSDHARRIVPGGNSMSTLQSNRIAQLLRGGLLPRSRTRRRSDMSTLALLQPSDRNAVKWMSPWTRQRPNNKWA